MLVQGQYSRVIIDIGHFTSAAGQNIQVGNYSGLPLTDSGSVLSFI